ncbi:MAG: DUF2283 domain-containing protein [Candidatus Methanoperedens sp.]|nr:DUF2283 domain-containing protein [Candidatus Methanoperedens sp.]
MIKESKASNYDYDMQNDSIFFYSDGHKYKESIDADGIILDFSEDDNIMGIEILGASERFNVSKPDLLNIKDFNANIEISKENIEVTIKMAIYKRNKLIAGSLDAITINNPHFPAGTQNLALAC